jgi:hypothetical protein
MRETIKQRAAQASGNERFCGKCPHKTGICCVHLEVCHDAFIRGYLKGAKNEKKHETTK